MPSLEARKDGHQERLSPGLKKGQPHERWGEAGRAFQVEGTVCGRGKEGRGKWGHISGGDWNNYMDISMRQLTIWYYLPSQEVIAAKRECEQEESHSFL